MRGMTVTQAVKAVKQPRGGYVPPKLMVEEDLADDAYRAELIDKMAEEQSSPATIGVAVDYLTRFMLEKRTGIPEKKSSMECFSIPRKGIRFGANNLELSADRFEKLVEKVNGLDDNSIDAMFQLTAWDSMYRTGLPVDPETLHPNEITCKHVRMMVEKAQEMLGDSDVVIGPTFQGGYSKIIHKGDADYIRDRWLVDMKVSKKERPDTIQTLQLIVYYLLGKAVVDDVGLPLKAGRDNPFRGAFEDMWGIEILNPRCGVRWRLFVSEIPTETINEIVRDVMGGYNPDDLAEIDGAIKMMLSMKKEA